MSEKLLILTRQVGGGLDTITDSLIETLEDRYVIKVCYLEDVISKHLDGLLMKYWYTSRLDKKFKIWENVYKHAYLHRLIYAIIRLLPKNIICKKLVDAVQEFAPDKVLGTSFLPSFILSYAVKKMNFKTRCYGIVSNFDVPKLWDTRIDKLLLPHQALIDVALNNAGMKKEQLKVSGLPVSVNNLKLSPSVTLIMGGAWGLCDPTLILREISQTFPEEKFVVICGSNATIYQTLLNKYKKCKNILILPYVNDMDSLYSKAKCIITKPGMLTLAEASLRRIPLILIEPIPGHEEKNMNFMVSNNSALMGSSSALVIRNLKLIYSNDDLIALTTNNAFSIFEKSLEIDNNILDC